MSVPWAQQQINDITWYKNHFNKNIAMNVNYDYFTYIYEKYCTSIHGLHFSSAVEIGTSDTGGYLSVIPSIKKRIGIDPAVDLLREMDMLPLATHIRYRRGFCEDLPFKNDSVPLVIAANTLDHVKDMKKSASEIVRIMKPGGYFFFFTYLRVKKPHPFTFQDAADAKSFFPDLKVVEEHEIFDRRPFNRRSDAYSAIFQK